MSTCLHCKGRRVRLRVPSGQAVDTHKHRRRELRVRRWHAVPSLPTATVSYRQRRSLPRGGAPGDRGDRQGVSIRTPLGACLTEIFNQCARAVP